MTKPVGQCSVWKWLALAVLTVGLNSATLCRATLSTLIDNTTAPVDGYALDSTLTLVFNSGDTGGYISSMKFLIDIQSSYDSGSTTFALYDASVAGPGGNLLQNLGTINSSVVGDEQWATVNDLNSHYNLQANTYYALQVVATPALGFDYGFGGANLDNTGSATLFGVYVSDNTHTAIYYDTAYPILKVEIVPESSNTGLVMGFGSLFLAGLSLVFKKRSVFRLK